MDFDEIRIFLEQYQGDESDEARNRYLDLNSHAQANFAVLGELGPHDSELLRADIATALWLAETIGFRYQGICREPIAPGAIFIEDIDHYESTLTPNGSVSSRRDWWDREDVEVHAFLVTQYPSLERHFATGEA